MKFIFWVNLGLVLANFNTSSSAVGAAEELKKASVNELKVFIDIFSIKVEVFQFAFISFIDPFSIVFSSIILSSNLFSNVLMYFKWNKLFV